MLSECTPRSASAVPSPSSARLQPIIKTGAVAVGLLLASLQGSLAQMAVPGDFSVSSTGGASYKIPVVVPPGTAGMTPSLSLEYSSETGGNSNGWLGAGLLGVGWTLGGLPAIGRCPQTVAQDGAVGSITYTSSDRFCLDGQRLVAISGTYGADGTQYRTEVESFSLIISHGAAGTGPAWFEVHTKAGQIMQFGNTPDSQIPALSNGSPTGTARSWAVNEVSDTKGNYYSVTYTNDTTNGQAYPVTINYTGNAGAGVTPYNSVQFVYASRPDVVPIYQAGSLMQTTVRLTDVQTYAQGQLVRDYKLSYQQGSATGRSQVASVSVCGGDGTCLEPTTFTWQNGSITPTVNSNVGNQNGQLTSARPYLGNFTGSGLTSVMWDLSTNATTPISDGTRELWSFDNNQFSVTNNFAGQNGTLSGYIPIIADFNRDGRSDVWWWAANLGPNGETPYASGPTTTWFSTGDGTYAVASGPTAPTSTVVSPTLLGADDINGDGRTDLYWIGGTPTQLFQPASESVVAWLAPSGSALPTISAASVESAQSTCLIGKPQIPNYAFGLGYLTAQAADFNGDGFSDLLWYATPNGSTACQPLLWLGNGLGGFTAQSQNQYASVADYVPYLGDFNGDGKMDILWDQPDAFGRSTGNHILWLSEGNGSFQVINNPGGLNGGSVAGYVPLVADFNGDGIADILWVSVAGTEAAGAPVQNGSTGSQVLWLGQGNGNFTVTANFMGTGPVGYVPYVGDFNGDGKADVLWDSRTAGDSRSTGTRILWQSDGVPPDLLTGITNGVGATINVAYASITNGPPLYTKGTTASDPTVDIKAPMQVVSQVTRSNGIGGTVATAYTYATAQMDNNGRGFLGFQTVTATDLQTNIVETTTYLQTYPFIMQQASDTRILGSTTLSSTTNTYGSNALTPAGVGGTREQVLLNETVTGGNDLGGFPLPTTTTTYQYDAFNNATQIAVAVNDGSTKTTNNTFTNDTTNWFLGRLITSSVTSTAP